MEGGSSKSSCKIKNSNNQAPGNSCNKDSHNTKPDIEGRKELTSTSSHISQNLRSPSKTETSLHHGPNSDGNSIDDEECDPPFLGSQPMPDNEIDNAAEEARPRTPNTREDDFQAQDNEIENAREDVSINMPDVLPAAEDTPAAPGNHGRVPRIIIASVLWVVWFVMGVLFFHFNDNKFDREKKALLDPIYFTAGTMLTVGLGDIKPRAGSAKQFTSFFSLGGVGLSTVLFSGIADWIKNWWAGRKFRRWVLVIVAWFVAFVLIAFGALLLWTLGTCKGTKGGYSGVNLWYGSIIMSTTTGFGDIAFSTPSGRALATFWLFLSVFAVGTASTLLVEEVISVIYQVLHRRRIRQRGHAYRQDRP